MSNFETYWNENGLNLITPRGLENPEGFDIGVALNEFTDGQYVLEIGCGTGRIAKCFDPSSYYGMDINHNAIIVARQDLPHHSFEHIGIEGAYPEADLTLFYTVLLHIPDDLIDCVVSKIGSDRILVCEIMNPKYRKDDGISNQRSLEDYNDLFGFYGYSLKKSKDYDYAYYKGEKITFALYERD